MADPGSEAANFNSNPALAGETLEHRHLLQLMGAIDDLLRPWSVDLSLAAELSDDLQEHIRLSAPRATCGSAG